MGVLRLATGLFGWAVLLLRDLGDVRERTPLEDCGGMGRIGTFDI